MSHKQEGLGRLNADRVFVPEDWRDNHRGWRPGQRSVLEKCTFTVPDSVSEERVQDAGAKYRNVFGTSLVAQGWTVLQLDGPNLDDGMVARGITDPDRRRYVIWAEVKRQPSSYTFDVPDEDVAMYEKAGFSLN